MPAPRVAASPAELLALLAGIVHVEEGGLVIDDAAALRSQGIRDIAWTATFAADEGGKAELTGHSTSVEAAAVARDAGVRRLVLTHISARYTREAPELLSEAQAVFPETIVARDGMVVDVPFADAGQDQ